MNTRGKSDSGDPKMSRQLRLGRPRGGPGGHGAPIESAKDVRAAMKRLASYLLPFHWALLGILVLLIVSTLLGLAGPYLFGVAVDTAIAQSDLSELVRISLILLGAYLLAWATGVLQTYWTTVVSQRVLRTLRQQLFDHMQILSLKFFDDNDTGDLMSRLTNDVDAINRVLSNGLTQLASSVLTIVGIMVAMLMLNVPLALVTLLVVPAMMLVTGVIARYTRGAFREMQWAIGALNAESEENIAGVRVVQAFRREADVIDEFKQVNAKARNAGIRAETVSSFLPPFLNIMGVVAVAIITGFGGWLVIQQIITIGIIVSFISYARRFFHPIRSIAELYNTLQSALAGAERIFQLLDAQAMVTDKPDAIPVPQIAGRVEFDHVSFGYEEGVPVLDDISLVAEPGQTIALVGPTGAGKTTMINLLSRFYDVDSGHITIDGHDVRDVQQDSLRRQLGIVLQEPFLFSDTLMENIRYGRLDATDDEVVEAAELANADQFITRLPEGYDTPVSERGGNLSEGQRQLIAIARAILADPRILILDEATSSVDTRTEIHIQEAMLKLLEGRTAFVIAHRLSTIRNADQVLVIDDHRILERGTHDELLDKKGHYFNLYMSQFRRTEAMERRVNSDASDESAEGTMPAIAPTPA